jgi:hypothetical protein
VAGKKFNWSNLILVLKHLHSLDHTIRVVAGFDHIVQAAEVGFLLILSAIFKADDLLCEVCDCQDASRGALNMQKLS